MSNFQEFYNLTQGMPDTAQRIFVASTTDALATVEAANYLNDKVYTTNTAVSGDYIYNSPMQAGDILYLHYGVGGSPGFTLGYVSAISATEFNFVVGVQGVVPGLLLAKKVVRDAAFAGGAALVTITDAASVTTDVVVAATATQTNAEALLKIVPGAGSIAFTFAADPGAGTISYVSYATV